MPGSRRALSPEEAPPPLPGITVAITDDYTAKSRCDEGYLRVKRRFIRATYPTVAGGDEGSKGPSASHAGEQSEPFKYDCVERWNEDAVSVLLHFVTDGERNVLLRSAVRPPLALRPDPLREGPLPYPEGADRGELWEVPAGLVEESEKGADGLLACVVREVKEEVGIDLEPSRIRTLGGAMFPSAGIIGEAVYLYEAEIDGGARPDPEGDGPLERGARIIEVPLARALEWCDRGLLPDAKTELSLRRLDARLRARAAASPAAS